METSIRYRIGIPAALRGAAVALYDEAFAPKLGVAVPDPHKRRVILAGSIALPFAVSALAGENLAGLAGFHTRHGSLTGGMGVRPLFRQLGLWGGLRATAVFSLFLRKPEEGELLMDGIAVRGDMRGRGIGTHLLDRLKRYARENGYSSVRLDVIDTNSRARRLYERHGFLATRTESFHYLRHILGFGAATTMVYRIGDA